MKFFEGCKLSPYTCPGGVLTIGYGETGKHVVPGLRLTNEQEADARLRARLAKEFEPAVRRHVKVTLAQHQFDALVSLSFNIGAGAFHRSTLLRKLNAGDVAGAAEQFHVWKWAGGSIQQSPPNQCDTWPQRRQRPRHRRHTPRPIPALCRFGVAAWSRPGALSRMNGRRRACKCRPLCE
ncbi:lysozyme [Xylella fastidiosa]|uniref:lysozyme n=1 Tax=Xylella fastidiosa TaxID=2371 RepID=UPI00373FE1E0